VSAVEIPLKLPCFIAFVRPYAPAVIRNGDWLVAEAHVDSYPDRGILAGGGDYAGSVKTNFLNATIAAVKNIYIACYYFMGKNTERSVLCCNSRVYRPRNISD
jgi:hypothetical protein